MTKEQIVALLLNGSFPDQSSPPELIETHISWVFMGERYVFKIKKPIRYSFLDFSNLEKRKYYCEREVELNRRLTDDIYIDVQPVSYISGRYHVGHEEGEILDYAVRMHKLDPNRRMDLLLGNNEVTEDDIKRLAKKIAGFHENTPIIHQKDILQIQNEFSDLNNEADFLREHLGAEAGAAINRAIESSNRFISEHKDLFTDRLKSGFYRDGHGDLHSRNIFLLPDPQPFDCIEFNDEFRQIDVLNEVAFLCMDLDVLGKPSLSNAFLHYYNEFFPCIRNEEDEKLFIYYKTYRANIRAKVNSLRARSSNNEETRKSSLAEVDKYLKLMDHYVGMM